jgi:hypothetical protein
MRLISALTSEVKEFVDDEIPQYAILSHTWGEEEVSIQELSSPSDTIKSKAGFEKIQKCLDRTLAQGLKYCWIDTCCIDKTSSAELSEAINCKNCALSSIISQRLTSIAMFQWYSKASVCFAYLSDVSGFPDDDKASEVQFKNSRWFTRGWTLQELIAPERVIFLNAEWNFIGSKISLRKTISEITDIDEDVLNMPPYVPYVTVARRMSWAAKRKTTRVEDIAYSLLGIFNVNMPLLYGEGEKAFVRLQEAILRETDDHTILAWEYDAGGPEYVKKSSRSGSIGVLASHPSFFSKSRNVFSFPGSSEPLFTMRRCARKHNSTTHF